MRDARVAEAISHWAPRFVSNGVLPADFEELAAGVERWEDWCAAWSARARAHETLGREALAGGWRLTAGEHLARAAIYYHFARFVFVQDPVQSSAAHTKSVECYRDALPWLRPPGERVEIPFAATMLKAVLRRPASGGGPVPVVVMAPGLDSTKEELHAYEPAFLDRGIATLAIDGPGQGEAEEELPIAPDYEGAASAVVDWVAKRSGLHAQKIAIWGVGLGGYFAARAAAFEKRFLACISVSGPFDWLEIWDRLPGLAREAFRVRARMPDEAETKIFARQMNLKEAAKRITCPLLVVAGRQDRVVPAEHAERLAAAARGQTELLAVEDGGHNADNRPHRYRSRAADWLSARFGLPKS